MSDKKVWSDHDGGGVCDSFSLCVFSLLDVCGSLFTPECVRPVWAAQGSYHKIGYRSGAVSPGQPSQPWPITGQYCRSRDLSGPIRDEDMRGQE